MFVGAVTLSVSGTLALKRLKRVGYVSHLRGSELLAEEVLRVFAARNLIEVEDGCRHLAPAK
jgi:hypothetical protein